MTPRSCCTLLAAAVVGLGLAGSAMAQPRHDERHEGRPSGFGPHGYPSHPWTDHDRDRWRGGAWQHTWHNGRFGWWWMVGPEWYFYPAPIYPYPNPFVPPAIAAPQGNMWYWCAAPQGYYPYVSACQVPWQAVAPR